MNDGFALAIESSTYLASCALFPPGSIEPVAEDAVRSRGAEGERLLPAIDAVLRSAGVAPRNLSRVICGAGPGSFTSLRVGAAIAKGLARGSGASLEAVPSLALLVASSAQRRPAGAYLAVVDAMRGERFVQGMEVGSDGRLTMLTAPTRIAAGECGEFARRLGATTIGPGEGVDVQEYPHARGSLHLSDLIRPVDLAAWEPDYGRLAEAQARWEAAHGRPLAGG